MRPITSLIERTPSEARISRTLERLEATPEDLEDGGARLIERITREARPGAVDAAIRELRSTLEPRLDTLERVVGEELPGVLRAVLARERVMRWQEGADLEPLVRLARTCRAGQFRTRKYLIAQQIFHYTV